MKPTVLTDFKKSDIKKPFLTYSVWQAFLDCPAKFYFQYFLKIKGPPRVGTGFGSAWDCAQNVYAEAKLHGKLNMSDVLTAFDAEYDAQLAGAEWKDSDLFTPKEAKELRAKADGEIPAEEKAQAIIKTTKFWKDWGTVKLAEYDTIIGPTVKPAEVQKEFFVDFGPNIPWGLKGKIDRIDTDGAVVDNKTAKSRWSQADVDYDLQGATYALVYRILNGKPENRIQYDVLVKTKTQTFEEQFQQLVVGIEPHRFDLILSEMTSAFENIRDGRLGRRTHKFTQSCSWCEFRKDCWEPSQVWARLPSPEEIESYKNSSPEAERTLSQWIEGESAKERLVNWREVGRELSKTLADNPLSLQFFYGNKEEQEK